MWGSFHLSVDLFGPVQVFIGDTFSTKTNGAGLEELSEIIDFFEFVATEFEDYPSSMCIQADQPLRVQVPKCFANWRRADLQFLGQFGLDEASAALEAAVEYGASERLPDELMCRLARRPGSKAGTQA